MDGGTIGEIAALNVRTLAGIAVRMNTVAAARRTATGGTSLARPVPGAVDRSSGIGGGTMCTRVGQSVVNTGREIKLSVSAIGALQARVSTRSTRGMGILLSQRSVH